MKSIYAAVALGLGGLALGACAEEAVETEEAAVPLAASDAQLFLPAVEGNPGALYFTLENSGDRPIVVRRADVEGAASAELHDYTDYDPNEMGAIGQVSVPAGGTAVFEPGGQHVMAFELDPAIEAGGTTKVTLTMVGGKTMEFEADILPADAER